MQCPTILVVMPLYNAVEFVKKAVDSIFSQTYTNYQLLIIDDGSSDGSGEIIRRYIGDKAVLWHQSNSGPGVAMNRALQYAEENRIPFIARMDADDLSMPTRLDVQFNLMEKHPDAAACSSNCYYIDRKTEEIVGASTVSSRPTLIKWEINNGLRGLVQGAALFRTNALVSVGGYRPEFRSAEETDLFLRLAENHQLVNAKEYLYKIRMSNAGLSTRDVQKNLLYHFHALSCSRNRRLGKPEDDFDLFLRKMTWRLYVRIQHEKFVLRLWRSNIAHRNYLMLLIASLIDPRRTVVRLLRML